MNATQTALTKKSKFQPVLIDKNQSLYEQILALGSKACAALPAVKEAYEALRIGTWDNDAYQAVLNEIHHLEQEKTKKVQAHIETLPYRSETAEREIMDSVKKQLASLRGAVEKLRSAAESKSMLYSIHSRWRRLKLRMGRL